MATLYLLIRNISTGEASGLIKAEDICDACFELVEKETGVRRIDFYNNFYREDMLDITTNIDIATNDYSDLAIIKRKLVINATGDGEAINDITVDPSDISSASRTYPNIDRRKYLSYLTESLFETYSEFAGLPVYEASALKHIGKVHWILDQSDVEKK